MRRLNPKLAVVFFTTAGLGMFILAIGVSQVPFYNPQPLRPGPVNVGPEGFQRLVMYFYVGLLLLLFLWMLFTRRGRKSLFVFVTVIVLAVILLNYFGSDLQPSPTPTALPTRIVEGTSEAPLLQAMPSDEIDAAPIPNWVITLIGVVLAAILTSGLGLTLWKLSQAKQELNLQDSLSQQAQQAIADLQAGAEFKDVILRCYAQMSRILQTEMHLERQSDMTPREFELRLDTLGFPAGPIQQLTRLFEAARYGQLKANQDEQRLALESLEAIQRHCLEQMEPAT